MPVSMSDESQESWYLIGKDAYEPAKPSGRQNLTDLYGLTDLAASVARFDPETNAKRKLRKSYKNQISDLPGKHSIPGSAMGSGFSLLDLARRPPNYDPSKPIPPLKPPIDQKTLSSALNLDKTPATGLPDFDITLLASPNYIQQLQQQEQQQQQQPSPSNNNNNNNQDMQRTGSMSNNTLNNKNLRNGIASASITAGESSQDDSAGTRRLKTKKKRFASGTGSGYDSDDIKRRKRA